MRLCFCAVVLLQLLYLQLSVSDLCFDFCFANDQETIEISDIESSVQSSLQDYISTEYHNALSNITCQEDNAQCFECCAVDLKQTNLTESDRWIMLYSLNEDMTLFAETLSSSLSIDISSLASIDYFSASYFYNNDTLCDSTLLPYPRVCKLLLTDDFPDSAFHFSMSINSNTDKLHYALYYGDESAWFGVGFGEHGMYGDSAIYSTGLDDGLSLNIHSYHLNGTNMDGVHLYETQDFTDISSADIDGTFVVYWQRAISDQSDFDGTETSITSGLFFAAGTDTQLEYHSGNSGKIGTDFSEELMFVPSPQDSDLYWCDPDTDGDCTINLINVTFTSSTSTTSTTAATTAGSTGGIGECPVSEDDETGLTQYGGVTYDGYHDIYIEFMIDCDENKMTINITHNNYNENWFGIVFNDQMRGDSIIWTTGKQDADPVGLYFYDITGKSSGMVSLNENESGKLIEENTEINEGGTMLNIIYSTTSETFWDIGTTKLTFRVAQHSSILKLIQHTSYSKETYVLDLLTGKTTKEEDDLTLIITHGVFMWSSWFVFASIGILSSAQRHLCSAKGLWFKMHKYFQITTIVLCLIGFFVAVAMTHYDNGMHFHGTHQILGLTVVIVAFTQPFIAWVRPHAPDDDHPKKSSARWFWEIIHKTFGYFCWFAAIANIYLGFLLVDEQDFGYIHIGLSGAVVLAYIILSIYGYCKKPEKPTRGGYAVSPEDDEAAEMVGGGGGGSLNSI